MSECTEAVGVHWLVGGLSLGCAVQGRPPQLPPLAIDSVRAGGEKENRNERQE